MLSTPPPTTAHCVLRHLKARHNDQQSSSPSGLWPGFFFFFPFYNQGACTQCMPSLFHCCVQIRDGSLTHTAERLKTTISPFSYPRQPQFLTLSLLLKPRRLLRSKAGLKGPCNSCTIFYRCTCLIRWRNLISADPIGVF